MSCCEAPTRILVLAVDTILLLSFFAAGEPQAPTGTKTGGAYYLAYRTPAHVSRSSPDVFHEIANNTLDFLKSNDVNIIADPERGTIQTDELFSLDSLLNLTKNASYSPAVFDRGSTGYVMAKTDAPILRLVRKGSLGRARVSNQRLLRKGRADKDH